MHAEELAQQRVERTRALRDGEHRGEGVVGAGPDAPPEHVPGHGAPPSERPKALGKNGLIMRNPVAHNG